MNASEETMLKTEYIASSRRLAWEGVKDSIPVLVGVIPFGVTCGLMALASGLTPAETLLMSALVFAGASQFIAITMMGSGVMSWGIITLTTLLINLRHLLMGASLAPYLLRLPWPLQALLAFGIVDESYVLAISRIAREGYSPSYQLGVNTSLYLAWLLSTAAGVVLGGYISDPLSWGLDFAMPATFLALLVPRLTDLKAVLVCLSAGIAAVLGALYLPGAWYIIIAALTATLVGGLMGGKRHAA